MYLSEIQFLSPLSFSTCIIFELKTKRVKIDDEDKVLQFIWSLPSSYEHMKPIMMYEKEAVVLSEFTSELFFEEE